MSEDLFRRAQHTAIVYNFNSYGLKNTPPYSVWDCGEAGTTTRASLKDVVPSDVMLRRLCKMVSGDEHEALRSPKKVSDFAWARSRGLEV
jgi:hypothetical protein